MKIGKKFVDAIIDNCETVEIFEPIHVFGDDSEIKRMRYEKDGFECEFLVRDNNFDEFRKFLQYRIRRLNRLTK